MALCQLVGHSYDLDVMNLWDTMEHICRWVSDSGEVWAATHVEIVRYLKAMKLVRITDREIKNESSAELWFAVDGKILSLQPGEKITLP